MRAIADDLALAQSPISEEDLMIHILTQLGDEYNSIAVALKLFDTGASNHVASDRNSLHHVSEYGGPDEILLGDGTGSDHGGASHARREN
ncbi:hypothetical protein L1887_34663 [Cichorium endivia]|nr:hypothetical protein L1887_34663 [Cichorium endivia]